MQSKNKYVWADNK